MSTNMGIGTDVHNLRACDYTTNASRSNDKFGFGTGNSGTNNDGDWYPGDEWKGDVARIIMYMHLRYPTECQAINVASGSVTYDASGEIQNILLDWNNDDPVSDFEMIRNDRIYQVQGNRNPFIDNPRLATRIWGGPQAQNLWKSNSCDSIVYMNITINNSIATNDSEVACDSAVWNGNVYYASGIVVDTCKLYMAVIVWNNGYDY